MKPGLFYRYIAGKFWPPFLFGTGIFAALAFLVNLFDHMNEISKTAAPLSAILEYFMYILPFWTLMVIPVAALLAELFVISEMMGSGEWVAGMASGYRPRQMAAPVLACCALVAVGHFALTETVSPGLGRRAEFIYERVISGNKWYHYGIKKDIVVRMADGIFLSAREFNAGTGTLTLAAINVQSEGRVSYQVDAESGFWSAAQHQWVFSNGVRRVFAKSGKIQETRFAQWRSGLDVEPGLMNVEKIWPEDVTIFELARRIEVLHRIGSPSLREDVFFHSKLAAPLVNFTMCLLALPFALSVRRGGKILHFTAAIGLAFFFWWANSVFASAGEAGMLAPWLAGWLPVAISGAAAAAMLRKAGL